MGGRQNDRHSVAAIHNKGNIIMRKDLVTLIMECVQNLPSENGEEPFRQLTEESALFGKDGILDSIGLVSLVVAIEQAIEDQYDTSISLADERALSQKRSPYKTIGSLAEYATRLLERSK